MRERIFSRSSTLKSYKKSVALPKIERPLNDYLSKSSLDYNNEADTKKKLSAKNINLKIKTAEKEYKLLIVKKNFILDQLIEMYTNNASTKKKFQKNMELETINVEINALLDKKKEFLLLKKKLYK